MNKKILRKKAISAIRVALALALVLANVLAVTPVDASAASYQGYEWTRINSRSEFESFMGGALGNNPKKSDSQISKGEEVAQDAKTANASDWFRVMMIYGDNQYFIAGNASCNGSKNFIGQRIKSTYGIDVNKDKFQTVSGLNTPYIKLNDKDPDNNCLRYMIRFSENDQLGSTYWTMKCKWAGIAGHAACSCDFYDAGKGRGINDWENNKKWYPLPSFEWSNDSVRLFYNVPGAADRGWEHTGDGEIECTQDYDDTWFKIYIGMRITIPVLEKSSMIEPGAPVCWNSCVVKDLVEIEIPYGATLVLDGICYNNGYFFIDGGTLIVRGVLDSQVGFDQGAGGIDIYDGTLIVEETGTLITRSSTASFSWSNAHVDIQGIALFSAPPQMFNNSSLRSGYSSAVCIAVKPNETLEQAKYTMAWVKDNKSTHLSQLCSDYGSVYLSGYNTFSVMRGSSVISDGIFYVNPNVGMDIDGESYVSMLKSTNVNASIESMMKHWEVSIMQKVQEDIRGNSADD